MHHTIRSKLYFKSTNECRIYTSLYLFHLYYITFAGQIFLMTKDFHDCIIFAKFLILQMVLVCSIVALKGLGITELTFTTQKGLWSTAEC